MLSRAIVLGVWGTGLVSSPFWGTGVLMATGMMNDGDQGKRMEICQMGCLMSLFAAPLTMATSVVGTYRHGYSRPLAFLPLIPIVSYVSLAAIGFAKPSSR